MNQYKNPQTNTGFVALISAIIISVILLLMVINVSLTAFYSRFNILDSELKERSSALAEACADTAMLKLANNSSYNPVNEVVTVGSDTCTIISVTGSITKTILTKADFKNYNTKLQIKVDATTIAVSEWKEI